MLNHVDRVPAFRAFPSSLRPMCAVICQVFVFTRNFLPGAAIGRVAFTIAIAAACVACGHPATKAECEEIFRRSAEIELAARKITDKSSVAKHIERARAAKGEKILKDCVGKRITDDAMSCVRRASTAGELDTCLQ